MDRVMVMAAEILIRVVQFWSKCDVLCWLWLRHHHTAALMSATFSIREHSKRERENSLIAEKADSETDRHT